MVLKVVTGKIFKTLGLSWSLALPLSTTAKAGSRGLSAVVRLSKNADYLIDNHCVLIIS